MIRNYAKHLAPSVFCMLLLVSGGSPLRAQSFDALAENIRAALVEEQAPSFAVAVARDGEPLLTRRSMQRTERARCLG